MARNNIDDTVFDLVEGGQKIDLFKNALPNSPSLKVKPDFKLKLAPPDKNTNPINAAPSNNFPKPLPAPAITGIKCISSLPIG